MKHLTYLKIIKASAWYDLVVVIPFAFPIIVEWNMGNLFKLHTDFSFSGVFPMFDPFHYFFVNAMGSIVLVWSLLRIIHTKQLYGLYDAFGRTLFSAWMIYYLVVHEATSVIVLFLIPEILWGIIQYYGYWKIKK